MSAKGNGSEILEWSNPKRSNPAAVSNEVLGAGCCANVVEGSLKEGLTIPIVNRGQQLLDLTIQQSLS
jgi:hypothetical protein